MSSPKTQDPSQQATAAATAAASHTGNSESTLQQPSIEVNKRFPPSRTSPRQSTIPQLYLYLKKQETSKSPLHIALHRISHVAPVVRDLGATLTFSFDTANSASKCISLLKSISPHPLVITHHVLFISFALFLLTSRSIHFPFCAISCAIALHCTLPLLCLLACPIWLLSFSLPSFPVCVWCFIMTPSLPQHQQMQVDATTTVTALAGLINQPTPNLPVMREI